MRAAFADTFYFLALANEADGCHERARGVSRDRTRPFVTTAWVLTEVADAMARRKDRPTFLRLLDDLVSDPRITIVPPTQELFERGIELYAQRPDKDWSLTDCISFAVMRQMHITEALTGDSHFEQAGFTTLLE